MKGSSPIARLISGGWGTAALLFLAVPVVLLHGVFLPDQTLFSNDGPLGELMANCHRLPGRFLGSWSDLDSVGFNGGSATPDISFFLQWTLGPVWFSKLYAVLSLWLLGVSAWLYFRESRLSPLACVLGGLAIVLNSTFFSVACWGVSAQVITAAMFFLALAALADTASRWRWWRVMLAGMAVGMGVMEGADVGAIFSVFVAVYVLYQAWTIEGSQVMNLVTAGGRLAVVAVFALFLAAQSIDSLVTTSIKGVVGTQQDDQTKAQRWDWATQWSMPKQELLGLVAPGLFGYRMDSQYGENYWGRMGRDPAWDTYLANGSQGNAPTGYLRYTGGGNYAGALVVLVALWAAGQSLRRNRKDPVYDPGQRKWLWFWLTAAGLSLLVSLGRFAPFYQVLYELPYFSTIRNPVKFIGPFSIALVVLFAFGIDGFTRQYRVTWGNVPGFRWGGVPSWWQRAAPFEKFFVSGCGLAWVASLAGWMFYRNHHDDLVQYLQFFRVEGDLEAVANFSAHQAGIFVLTFLLTAGLLVLIFSGAFAGNRAGAILLGLLLVADLGLANQPWIIYWNYPDKYSSNPIIEPLRDKPYEHRVVLADPPNLPPAMQLLHRLYKTEWLQHQFPYYNIQSFDVVEMPRMPADFSAFIHKINDTDGTNNLFHLGRAWQLTNTRFILGPGDFGDFWNGQGSLSRLPMQRERIFDIRPKPGLAAATRPDQLTTVLESYGHFAMYEFTAALPRAKLYQQWQVNTNDTAALQTIFSPEFDPQSSVVVDAGLPADSGTGTNPPANPPGGTVEYVHYAPKDIELKAEAPAASVLLLNDHFDPNWKVWVDGQPAALLRCNFWVRGVQVPPGTHQVEFKFQPPIGLLYVSVTAVASGLALLGGFIFAVNKTRVPVPVPVPVTATAKAPEPPVKPIQPMKGKRKQSVAAKAGSERGRKQ